MTNVIKLKRGLSQNISELNLQEGELAITTDTGQLFTSINNENKPIIPKNTSDLNNDSGFVSNSNLQSIVQDLVDKAMQQAQLNMYPVGSIYMSVDSTNPSSLFGGTWESWGSGRVPIGVNIDETDFNEAEKTGGSRTRILSVSNIPSHVHTTPNHAHTWSGTTSTNGSHTHNMGAVRQYMEYGGSPWITNGAANYGKEFADVTWSGDHSHIVSGTTSYNGAGSTGSTGSSTSFSIEQPYVTCYMWKRVL